MKVDGAPGVALEAGVKDPRGILQLSTFEERQLHDVLVGLACAYQAVVGPDRYAPPLPFFDDFRVGLLDQGADPGKCLATPVAQPLDSRVYQARWCLGLPRRVPLLFRRRLLHAFCLSRRIALLVRRPWLPLRRRYPALHSRHDDGPPRIFDVIVRVPLAAAMTRSAASASAPFPIVDRTSRRGGPRLTTVHWRASRLPDPHVRCTRRTAGSSPEAPPLGSSSNPTRSPSSCTATVPVSRGADRAALGSAVAMCPVASR